MAKHTYLLSFAQKLKKSGYILTWEDDNVLTISLDESMAPFCFAIVEPMFDGIALCFAVDFPDSFVASAITIDAMHCAAVGLGEQFYYANDGELKWDDEALISFELENNPELLNNFNPKKETAH